MSIIILRRFLYLLYLCPCLDLCLLMSHLCHLFFIFIFIFIVINFATSWVKTRLLAFFLIFQTMSYYFWMVTWMKNMNNSQIAKVYPQDVAQYLLDFFANFSLALIIKVLAIKKACIFPGIFYYDTEDVYVTIGHPAFCLFLYLTGIHFWGELQHGGDVSGWKIKCRLIRTREIGDVSLSDVLYVSV